MAITTEQVKALRDETGVSIMQCKKALEEAGGDIEKARLVLRRKGGEQARKKADRELGAGAVQAYVHNSNDVGALVLLSCETDFVAKNEEFVALARDIAMHVTAAGPQYRSRTDVPQEEWDAARELFLGEAAGKPADIREKVVAGKLDAHFKERVLLEQPFIKQPETTIGELINSAVQKFGERIELSRFVKLSARGSS